MLNSNSVIVANFSCSFLSFGCFSFHLGQLGHGFKFATILNFPLDNAIDAACGIRADPTKTFYICSSFFLI